MRYLLTPEVERKLQSELTELWNSRDPVYTSRQIAEELKFGVKGTPYEALREQHVMYYYYKFHLPHRPRSIFSHNYRPRKARMFPTAKIIKREHEIEASINVLQRAQKWNEFDGSWSEFVHEMRAQEREMNMNGLSTPSTT